MLTSFVAMEQRKMLMRHIRLVREVSLDAVAVATGINVSTVSRIERGLIKPTEPQRNALAGYFGKTIDELLAPVSAQEVA